MEKVELSPVPTAFTAIMITTEINAEIRPYSIAVTPRLSSRSLIRWASIAVFLCDVSGAMLRMSIFTVPGRQRATFASVLSMV